MTDVAEHFVSLRGRKEAEKELAVLIEALKVIPATERESRIAEALAQIAEQERRKSLLDKASKMSTEELERRLE